LKDVVGIISFKKENPNLLMHEIIFLIHTFDFQVALSISWDRVSFILKSDRSNITKLRICAHNLEIQKGRYFQINRTERIKSVHNLLIRTDLLLNNNFDFIVSLWKFGNFLSYKDTF
jgi:hypothetical protein